MIANQSDPACQNSLSVSQANVERFRTVAGHIKHSSETAVNKGKAAIFQVALLLLDSDEDAWPKLVTKDELVAALRHSYELWECLE